MQNFRTSMKKIEDFSSKKYFLKEIIPYHSLIGNSKKLSKRKRNCQRINSKSCLNPFILKTFNNRPSIPQT